MSPKEALKQSQLEATVEIPAENEITRDRSTIGFPYLDLDDAAEIAKGVHTVGGQSCQWDQLAAELQQSANGGGFRLRVLTARLFGFLTYDKGTVTLTPLGSHLCDPEQEKAARVEAFLNVPLYKAIYEQYKGATLPPNQGLETAIGNLGVAPKQISKARQIFQRSATEAGFFAYGNSRLVMPSIKASSKSDIAEELDEDRDEEKESKRKPDQFGAKRHPLIEGLLKELPEPQAEWTTEDRKKWLEMASTIFNVIYKDSDDSRGSLKVIVEKNSAKP